MLNIYDKTLKEYIEDIHILDLMYDKHQQGYGFKIGNRLYIIDKVVKTDVGTLIEVTSSKVNKRRKY